MKQICTFPNAPHSSPLLNARAYVVERDYEKSFGTFFSVWSPVHYPHLVGRFKTREAAQRRADKINGMGDFVYGL